ncbi:MAG: hypothetical protein M0T84_01885 [Betaproteobacteria bacterium]|nr:hypothetical protein [Betaproteobacteria bacterium]
MTSRRRFNAALVSGIAASLLPEALVHAATSPMLPSSAGTWQVRRMPTVVGTGPTGAMKHTRLAVDPVNQRIYFCGGDYVGPPQFYESGQQALYSYDVGTNQWRSEFPYCAPHGEIQPLHPVQVGWTFDTKRKVFWMLPGFEFATIEPARNCGDTVHDKVMSFDPATRLWSVGPQDPLPPMGGLRKFAQYDDATDSIVMFNNESACVFYPATGRWKVYPFGGNRYMSGNYTAKVGRHIYCMDNRYKKLSRYDIDERSMTDVCPLGFDPGRMEETNFVFDASHNSLVFAKFGSWAYFPPQIWIYNIGSGRWAQLPVDIPGVAKPMANCMVYNPGTRQTVLLGGVVPANPHMFLLRLS